MTARKNIEDKLEELGQAIGSDESLIENVMSRIDAKPIAESNRTDKSKNKLLLRRFVMNRLTKLAAAAVITIAVLIGIHHFKGSVDLATPAFAKMIEAMKKMPWAHAVFQMQWEDREEQSELWYSFASKIEASKEQKWQTDSLRL